MIDKIFTWIVKYSYAVVTAAIVIIVAFGQLFCTYTLEREFMMPNCILMVILAAVLISQVYMQKNRSDYKTENEKKPNYNWTAIIVAAVLFVYQIFLIYNIFFFTGGDPANIYKAAMQIADGSRDFDTYYFSMFRNNLLLTSFYGLIFKIWPSLTPILVLSAAENCLAAYLVFSCLKHHVSEEMAFDGFLIGVALFGLSPWIVGYYSDEVAFLIPILIYHIYLQLTEEKSRKNVILWIVMTLITIIGYNIKPTAAIPLLAIIIARFIKTPGMKQRLTAVLIAACLAVGMKGAGAMLDALYEAEGFELDDEQELGMVYFMMVGFNYDTDGFFSYDDNDLARTVDTKEERTELMLDTIADRISSNGPIGLIKHLIKKILLVFNDGSFAWGVEYGFYANILEETTPFSGLLRNIFYSDGDYFPYFLQFEQMVWLLVLMLLPGAFMGDCNEKKLTLMVSFLGLFVYQMLFEARSRYLFVMLPLIIMLAMIGADRMKGFIAQKLGGTASR